MIDRAHIRNGKIIQRLAGEKSWLELEDGSKVSPAVIGFTKGNDKVVPVEYEEKDTSTGSDTVKNITEIVEEDRVCILTTIRDKTTEEISKEEENIKVTNEQRLDQDEITKITVKALYCIAKDVVPDSAKTDEESFKLWISGLV